MHARRFGFLVMAALSAGAASSVSAQQSATYVDEPYVVEQLHNRVRFENDGTGRRETDGRVRIQNDAGVQHWGQLVFGYSAATEQVEIDRVEVHKPNGEIVKVTAEAIQDLSGPIEREAPVYSDYRERHVTVPSLRPGDVLTYHVTHTIRTPLVPGHFYASYDFARDTIVLDEQLVFDLPADRQVVLKVRPPLHDAATPTGSGRIAHVWHSSTLAHEKPEESPTSSTAAARALKKAMSTPPAIQLTTFRGWDEIAKWYADLARGPASADATITAKAAELTRGKTAPLEKLEALADYVAHNVRYVGLSFGTGRYVPHRAADVLSNQYGDCKDKHTLLAALASAAGLQVFPVLANSMREIDPDVPSPAQFDHVISVMPVGTDRSAWIWTDTTTAATGFRVLLPTLRGKQMLLASASTDGNKVAALIETPKHSPIDPTERVEVVGTLSELGTLDVRTTMTEQGDGGMALREAFARVPRAQWPAVGEYLAKSSWIGGKVTEVTPSNPAATREPFVLSYRQVREAFITWENGKRRMPLPVERLLLPATSEDDWKTGEPVELPEGETRRIVRLEFPASVMVQAPVDVNVSRDYVDYRTTYHLDGHTLTADRVLRWKLPELPAARGADYLAFTRALRADEDQRVALELKAGTVPGTAATSTASATELYRAAYAAQQSRRYDEAIALYTRLVAMEPKHAGGAWTNLGIVYAARNRFDEAVAAYHKQIEINPFDQYAWNHLGFALKRQYKFDEAAAAFRKQIEINPLDQWPHRNLGLMLNERGQYAEARVELEKAIGIAPNEAYLRVAVGGVYLRLKLDAAATASFDKAVQLSPTPLIWNDIAYTLAQNDAHLDRAQQYAESALTTITVSLRQATIDTLTSDHLQAVQSLASFWDTLGWVHFKRGDLDAAERYLRAAWNLTQNFENGEHIKALFAKKGDADIRLAEPPLDTIPRGLAAPTDAPALTRRVLVLIDSTSKTADIKFVGDDAAAGVPAALLESLRTAQYWVGWPDATPTKLVRRGTLTCRAGAAACELLFEKTANVRTLEP